MLTNRRNLGLVFLLALYLVVSISIGLSNPLGEAPDEVAHMQLIRFIGRTGHLPQDYGERAEAGYKSDWPMLYHLVQGRLVGWVGPASRPQLKVNSLSTQRLLVFDGLSPFSLIHTWDERFPFQGIVLSWHLARLLSSLLGLGTLFVVYRLSLLLFPDNITLALASTATAATMPQFHLLAGSVNDDNLLGLLLALYTLWLVKIWKQPNRWQAFVWAGLCFGLAFTTKYSATPLVLTLLLLLIYAVKRERINPRQALTRLLVFGATAITAAAWWIIFIIWHFNEIASLGLWRGTVNAFLSRATADVTMRQTAAFLTGNLTVTSLATAPTLTTWRHWLSELFQSFWLIRHPRPAAVDAFLLVLFLGLTALALSVATRSLRPGKQVDRISDPTFDPIVTTLFATQILLLLPFPLLRFWMTRNVLETAQGRHILVPALSAIGLFISLGWWQFLPTIRRRSFVWILPTGLLLVSLANFFGFWLPSFPPPLPVRTTLLDRTTASQPATAVFQSAIELVSIDVAQVGEGGALPVTLTWRSLEVVRQDYLVGLWLTDEEGRVAASWLGHPVNGRYPTRVWEPGDVIQDSLWLPALGLRPGTYPLHLNLCPVDTPAECFQDDRVSYLASVAIPVSIETPRGIELTLPDNSSVNLLVWQQGRTHFAPAPFTFRASILVGVLDSSGQPVEDVSVELVDPNDTIRHPLWAGAGNAIFLVDAHWGSGSYRLRASQSAGDGAISQPVLTVSVQPRQFDLPPISQPVHANFGNEMELLGYDFPERRTQPGGQLPITLTWRALKPMQNHYILFNHLLAMENLQQWGGSDRVPVDYYSTVLWAAGEVVVDSYTIPVSSDAPAGIYRLNVGAYLDLDGATHSLPLVSDGQILDRSSVTIATVQVGGPPPGIVVSDASPEHRRNDNLSNRVRLVGYDLSQDADALTLTLYWFCETPLEVDYTTFVHIRPPNDVTAPPVAQMDRPAAGGAYPSSLWDPGETIRDQVVVPLQSGQLSGEYELVVGLYDSQTGQRLPLIPPDAQRDQPGQDGILLQRIFIHQ